MKIKKIVPDWLIGVAVTLLFLFIAFTGRFDFTDALEMKTFDLRARLAATDKRNPDIELVVITDEDLEEFGPFPWPRNILANAIQNLSRAGARIIALDIPFVKPEESPGLRAMKQLKDAYDGLGLAQKEPGLGFYQKLSQAVVDLDNDGKLSRAIKDAGNVVLPVYFDTHGSGSDAKAPDFMARHAFTEIKGLDEQRAVTSLIWLSQITPIVPAFAESAAGIGHINLFPDSDGYIREQIHVLGYLKDIYFPSYPIAIVQAFKRLKREDVTVSLGQGIDLRVSPSSIIRVPVIDPRMRTLINWNKGPGVAFHQTPFAKIYKGEIQTSLFKDKIVILGPTAPGIGDRFVTPVSNNLPGIEIVANSVANILNGRFLSRPRWIPYLELCTLLVFGLFITFPLTRLKAGMGAFVTLMLFISLAAAGSILFFSYNIWLRITPPILLLVIGYILVISMRFLIRRRARERVEADSVETNKMLGLSFQQQGMLDLALEKFSKISLGEEGAKDLLYNLGLDFERKRQFSKALSTYQTILKDGHPFKDLEERIRRLKGVESTMVFGPDVGGHPGDIEATIAGTDTKPTLGRYEISGELGRGAMGVVYKGEDPKIHRTVAIKTVSLSDFDEDVVEDIRERFFREAESAGLLTHPNIVTIYDCGEENDLAYIAMEYLEGGDLEDFTQQDTLLPLREALVMISKVADALDYAHTKGIVHRDIKPANIMYLKDTKEVKVADFGIARITTSSKTKTGVILGTPSYMSPEQIAGKKVDGRSDIFSLGVVLFEMLTGQKPFKAQDMTSLMYQIAKEKHAPVRSFNPRIPQVIEKIIDKALEKEVEARYARAGVMAEHLRAVITKIDELQGRKGGRSKQ